MVTTQTLGAQAPIQNQAVYTRASSKDRKRSKKTANQSDGKGEKKKQDVLTAYKTKLSLLALC